ncbi:MAG: hypothetical protein JWL79_907 [Frankiales bacterium]|nr:hypothetical protein [Frankiales bacterium]
MAWKRPPEPPLDPFERAARRVDPQYAQLAEAAVPPSSWRAPRLLLFFGILVVAAAIAKGGSSPTPTLKASCTTPAFVLGSTTIDHDAPVTWSASGPQTARVALALDSPTAPTPALLDGPTLLDGCLVHGSFAFHATPGAHTVTAFLLGGDGSTRVIRTTSVTVR